MKPTRVPGIIVVSVLFHSLILHSSNLQVEAASIICGNDSASKTASFKTAAAATNEQSSTNQESSSSAATSEATSTTTTTAKPSSDVKQFFQTVQCTLEKAKPWVEEIEKEAKRLEETAKRFSEGVINKLGDFIERLVPNVDGNNTAFTAPTNIPTKSLFSSILDGFENVVVGVVGTVTGNRIKPTKVEEPVKEVAAAADVAEVAPAADVAEAMEEAVAVPVKPLAETNLAASDASTVAHNIEHANDLDNQIAQTSDVDENLKQICPSGFVADVNGICQRVKF